MKETGRYNAIRILISNNMFSEVNVMLVSEDWKNIDGNKNSVPRLTRTFFLVIANVQTLKDRIFTTYGPLLKLLLKNAP